MKTALVVGSAECVWDDIDRASDLFEPDVTIAINRFARDYPASVDCWFSYHPETFQLWANQRRRNGLPDHLSYGTCRNKHTYQPDGFEPFHLTENVSGSSGLGAVECARAGFGADRIVLAGIPMDTRGHFNYGQKGDHDVRERWAEGERYRAYWRKYFLDKPGLARSLSGWTRDLLGEPTEEWLDG